MPGSGTTSRRRRRSRSGVGFLRFNNDTASATALYISETDTNAIDQAALLATWDDASNTIRGTLDVEVRQLGIFAAFHITGTRTDNGMGHVHGRVPYRRQGVPNNDAVVLNFQRAGRRGARDYEYHDRDDRDDADEHADGLKLRRPHTESQ